MKKVITGVGILVLLGILGGGWFFSGVTYEVGLNPEFENTSEVGVAEDRVTIENITQGTISLNVEEEMWGVMLEDGVYGVLGAKWKCRCKQNYFSRGRHNYKRNSTT